MAYLRYDSHVTYERKTWGRAADDKAYMLARARWEIANGVGTLDQVVECLRQQDLDLSDTSAPSAAPAIPAVSPQPAAPVEIPDGVLSGD